MELGVIIGPLKDLAELFKLQPTNFFPWQGLQHRVPKGLFDFHSLNLNGNI
jgi:hypothetical protein